MLICGILGQEGFADPTATTSADSQEREPMLLDETDLDKTIKDKNGKAGVYKEKEIKKADTYVDILDSQKDQASTIFEEVDGTSESFIASLADYSNESEIASMKGTIKGILEKVNDTNEFRHGLSKKDREALKYLLGDEAKSGSRNQFEQALESIAKGKKKIKDRIEYNKKLVRFIKGMISNPGMTIKNELTKISNNADLILQQLRAEG